MSDGLRLPLPSLRPPAGRAVLPGARARLPAVAALAAATVGAINVLSALTPSLPGRLAVLLTVLPAREVEAAHALALPAGVGLLIAAWFLRARRRRALIAAVGLLAGLGVLDLVKGLDVEEATLSFALAAVLYRGRAAFDVRHDIAVLPRALAEAAAAVAAAVVAGFVAVAAAADGVRPAPRPAALLHETLALLGLMAGPLRLGERGEWAPAALGALGVATLALVATLLLRPLGVGRGPVPPVVRGRVADLVHRHGVDTLSAFKLRGDLRYLLDAGGRACVGYRVVRGVLLIAGDPVGPPEALPGLLAEVRAFAREHGLRVGAVNASAAFRALAAGAGLRALYLGDEAIVDTAGFGGPARPLRKKVRQAVRRVERAGLRADLRPVAALEQEEVAALAAVAERWRSGAPDRGFSTAMDRLVTQELPDAIVVAALDAGGRPRGFLHYLPAYGRHAMSLSAMCRDPDTPNGTMEYLLVRSIEMLRERGVAEVSLNFAAFARWLHAPASPGERVLGRIVALADPFFQIESLYRFNAKLGPRWEPRYLLHERLPALPRTVLAALSAEGHLPRPRLPRPGPRLPQRRRAGGLLRGALGLAGCVLAVLAGIGWLYLLRHAGALRTGPPVREALPLQRLAGGARQPLARLLAAWMPAGVVAGLALRLTPLGRAGRALAAGAIGFCLLAVLGWASDSVTASETLRFTPQLGRAALWLAAGLVALGALIPPLRGVRPAASAEEARAAGATRPGTGGAAAP